MFCHKCGAQIAEGAEFCHKCGAKVVSADAEFPVTPVVVDTTPKQEPQPVPNPSVMTDDSNEFRMFIDNHVRATTKFQSAEELLRSKKPQRFKWVCYGVPAVLFGILFLQQFSLVNLLVCAAFVWFIGFLAAALCDLVFTVRITMQTSKAATKPTVNINIEDLLSFLNTRLMYLQPYFHEWGYIRQAGMGVQGTLVASAVNSAADQANEVILGTEFGEKRSCFVKFNIKNDVTAINAGYSIGAAMINMRISRYVSIVKAAPVLQATMEYYLKYYNHNQGGNEDVLS